MTEQQNGNSGEEQKPASDQLVAVEVQAPPPEQQRGPSREELIEALQKSREEAKALRDRMLRVLADVDNQRKRLAREREEIVKFGQEKLLRELLPVLDNLERSLQHLPADSQDVAVAGLRNGVANGIEPDARRLTKFRPQAIFGRREKLRSPDSRGHRAQIRRRTATGHDNRGDCQGFYAA
jgi:hypothetical protein